MNTELSYYPSCRTLENAEVILVADAHLIFFFFFMLEIFFKRRMHSFSKQFEIRGVVHITLGLGVLFYLASVPKYHQLMVDFIELNRGAHTRRKKPLYIV